MSRPTATTVLSKHTDMEKDSKLTQIVNHPASHANPVDACASHPSSSTADVKLADLVVKPILSGWQPSPSAIMRTDAKRKDVENRPKPIRHLPRIIGIASCAKVAPVNKLTVALKELYPTPKSLPCGVLLGWVEIIECRELKDAQDWEWADRATEGYAWKIGRVFRLEIPMPVKGKLGFWYLDLEQQKHLLNTGRLV